MPNTTSTKAHKRLKFEGQVEYVIGNWKQFPDLVDPARSDKAFFPVVGGLSKAVDVNRRLKSLPPGEYVVLRVSATPVAVTHRTEVDVTLT